MKTRTLLVAVACTAALATGCVSEGRYDAAVASGDAVRAELASTRWQLGQRQAEAAEGRASMQRSSDALTQQIEHLSADSRALLEVNGSLERALDAARREHVAAESRAALYRDLALRLKSMLDAGDLTITLRRGRMVLRLSNDVLFDSGHAGLKPEGKRALAQIASVLSTLKDRRFQVEGHTDDEPIHRSPYKSNWDLSTARALEVTSFLVTKGVAPYGLSAAGYGEFDPVDSNGSPAGKAHNRRTEIALQPDIDEIVAVPTGQ